MDYTISKDCEMLWHLVRDGKEIVCFVTEKGNRFTALAYWFKTHPEGNPEGFIVSSHRETIFVALNMDDLQKECEKKDLSFILPNTKDNEILPCPFCGDKSPIVCVEDNIYSVWCPECASTGAKDFDRDGAIQSWNKRT